MVRLFVAIELPEEICRQFFDVQTALRSSRARLSLVDQDSMHITLKFIGEVSGSLLPQITSVLQAINSPPFSMEVGLIGTNSQKAPRVVWAEVDDHGPCRALAAEIDSSLGTLGIEPEKRKFRPHITIARVRRHHQSLFEALAEVAASCSGTIYAREFVLKKSELTPGGPIYTDILRVPLKENS
ncbi:MAG: RNA 2',3'-cyclic phosphodiesterase [Methanomicrobiales archaeon]|jgi:2'-5' RNA ligase|nr:RNA 2',3'-cyclic phosphodiesterase [Methanomicrobiales archaeon]